MFYFYEICIFIKIMFNLLIKFSYSEICIVIWIILTNGGWFWRNATNVTRIFCVIFVRQFNMSLICLCSHRLKIYLLYFFSLNLYHKVCFPVSISHSLCTCTECISHYKYQHVYLCQYLNEWIESTILIV